MKRITLMGVAIVCLTIGAAAQKIDAGKVPANVKTAFAKKYPGISPKWEMEDGKFEAGFKQNGVSTSVLLDAAGSITETETDMSVSQLPAAVLAYAKQHYAGKKIKEGAKITKADGTFTYEAEIDGKDLIFDSEGKFLKEIK